MTISDSSSRLQEGELLLSGGDLHHAAIAFAEAIEHDPKNARAFWRLYEVSLALGQAEHALISLNQAIELEPDLVDARTHMAVAKGLFELKRLDLFENAICRACSVGGSLMDAWRVRLKFVEESYNIIEVLKVLEEMKQNFPELTQPDNKLHVNLNFLSAYWAKEQSWRELIDQIDRDSLRFEISKPCQVALAAIRSGRLGPALSQLQARILNNPEDCSAAYFLAVLCFHLYNMFGADRLGGLSRGTFDQLYQHPTFKSAASYFLAISKEKSDQTGKTASLSKIELLQEAQNDPILAEKACLHQTGALYALGKMDEAFKIARKFLELQNQRIAAHPLGAQGLRILDEVNSYAMGHQAYLPDCYLKMQKLGWISPGETMLLAPPWFTANSHLLKYWEKYVKVVRDPALLRTLNSTARDIFYCNAFCLLPDGRAMSANQGMARVQEEWDRCGYEPLLKLSEEDFEKGWKYLSSHGVPKEAWFVALHVRGPEFKQQEDCGYNMHRNSKIESYYSAIKEITARGGWVIRMGEPSMPPMPEMPQVIDYAHDPQKCDWLDIFLATGCKFFLGSAGGMTLTPKTFGVPVVGVNYPPTPPQYNSHDIFIPKLMKVRAENRLLSFREYLSEPIIHSEDGDRFKELGYDFVDNTSDEILDATIEMLERLDGKSTCDVDDLNRQKTFKSYVSPIFGSFISQVGTQFLRKYSQLL